MFADDHPMYEIAGDLETANNNLIRNANIIIPLVCMLAIFKKETSVNITLCL